jgi:hypothetical protein
MSRNATLILNIAIFILIYFFSFHFYPKLNSNNKYDYPYIKTNIKEIFELEWIVSNSTTTKTEYAKKKLDKFLLKFLSHLNNSPDLLKTAPCPQELFKNNLRNIQIYKVPEDLSDFYNLDHFNIRFTVNRFQKSSIEKFDIDKCFNFLFVETLNKFYLVERDFLIQELENNRSLILSLLRIDLSFAQNITFSSFITEIKKGNVTAVKVRGSYLEGIFENGKKFTSYLPLYYDGPLLELLVSKGINITIEDLDKDMYKKLSILELQIQNHKKTKLLINPEAKYKYSQNVIEHSKWGNLLIFSICTLIFIIIKISSKIINKKQVSKFLNKFINT